MIIKGRAHTHNVISFMNLSLSYFIWNSSENFPIKSVFRKLIKMLCWLWIFTYVTMFILPYSNISTCFTDIIFATITFSLMHYRWDVAHLILQINDLMLLAFQIITKEHFSFVKLSNFLIKGMIDKRYSDVNCFSIFFFK